MKPLTIQKVHDYEARHQVFKTLYAGLQGAGGAKKDVSEQAMLAIISAWESIRTDEKADDLPQNEGPAAHEDLTVGEQIALMATVERDGDALLTFQDVRGQVWDLPEENVGAFLEEYGHEHASDYKEAHGHRWEDDFFILHDVV